MRDVLDDLRLWVSVGEPFALATASAASYSATIASLYSAVNDRRRGFAAGSCSWSRGWSMTPVSRVASTIGVIVIGQVILLALE
jgi:hypothetical protein